MRILQWLLKSSAILALRKSLKQRVLGPFNALLHQDFKQFSLPPVKLLESVALDVSSLHSEILRTRELDLLCADFLAFLQSVIVDEGDRHFLKHGRYFFGQWCSQDADQRLRYPQVCAILNCLSQSLERKERPASVSISDSQNTPVRRILFLTGVFPSPMHAGGLRIIELIAELRLLGNQVDLYTACDGSQDDESVKRISTLVDDFIAVPSSDFSPQVMVEWLESKSRSYDVIHFKFSNVSTFIPTIAPYGKLSIYTMMECETRRAAIALNNSVQKFPEIPDGGRLISALFRFLECEISICKNVDIVIGITPKDCAQATKLGAKRTVLVPTGISPEVQSKHDELEKEFEKSENVAVFIGNYEHLPNSEALIWYLVKVHPIVVSLVPTYQFRVVGAGRVSPELELLLKQQNVEYVGEVKEIFPEIFRSTICIAPLVTGAGFRGKINQYSALRRATVSTTIGNCGLPYENGVSILVADDPYDFANSIYRLLTDRNLRDSVAMAAQTICLREFSWSNIVHDLVRDVYGQK